MMGFIRGFFSNEISQAELDRYRRAATYINDLEVAVNAQILDRPLPAGVGPWARPPNHHYALLYTSIVRDLSTIAGAMLESDAREDPGTAGLLPVVTFEQVQTLYTQLPEFSRRAWEALANPRYVPDIALPITLGPRAEAQGKCPLVHLKGMYAAAASLDAIDKARIEAFLRLVKGSGVVPSDEVKGALGNLAQLWARAQADFGFANQQLAMVSSAHVDMATHEAAEDRLWDSLCDHFLVGQFVAMPELVSQGGQFPAGRRVAEADRWFWSDPRAAAELHGTQFGETEIRYFWKEKRWRTTAKEERFLAQCNKLLQEGAIRPTVRWATCPFDLAFVTTRPLTILGVPLPSGQEFHLDTDDSKDELQLGRPRFHRTSGYQEEHEGGHG